MAKKSSRASNRKDKTKKGAQPGVPASTPVIQTSDALAAANLGPSWDKAARKLTFGNHLLHRFHHPAPMAEIILDTFEEEGWPEHIDDPLAPLDGRREPDRLRKQIYALNRRLQNPLIKFCMDGTGQGLRWEAT